MKLTALLLGIAVAVLLVLSALGNPAYGFTRCNSEYLKCDGHLKDGSTSVGSSSGSSSGGSSEPGKEKSNAGRGNGSEGSPDRDPGKSGGHNKGGD
jgi:hypothetical protein